MDQLTNWGQALYQHSQIMTDDNPALSERLLLEALRKHNQALWLLAGAGHTPICTTR